MILVDQTLEGACCSSCGGPASNEITLTAASVQIALCDLCARVVSDLLAEEDEKEAD